MKLAPDNMPWKAVVASGNTGNNGIGLKLGDVNDKKALTVYVKYDCIHNSNDEHMVLQACLE